MSKDLNQCNFIGRLGKDIDLRYMPSGGAVASFSLACGDDYKDKNSGEKVERTNWINMVAFNKSAETLEKYCSKGSKLFVTGKMRVRKYQDGNGQDKWATEIVVDNFQMLDGRGDNQGQRSTQQQQSRPQQQDPQQQSGGGHDDFSDDIPF